MTDFETELKEKGYLVYTNVGVSMMPLLRQHRDVMVIRAVTAPPVKNDAVLFKRDNGQYVMHRIIKVYPDGRYYIAGDNCVSGERVRADQILGVLEGIKRDGKMLNVTDPVYLRYVRTVPFRRMKLKLLYFPRRCAGKMIRMIKKI